MSGRWRRACTARRPPNCSTAIAATSSRPGVRCCAAMSRRRRCIRNGPATATPGIAASTPCARSNMPGSETPSSAWLQKPVLPSHRAGARRRGDRRPCAAGWRDGPEQRDFPALVEFHEDGATDYFAVVYTFGLRGDPAHGAGVVMSFASDAEDGFDDAGSSCCWSATLPGLALGAEGARRPRHRRQPAQRLPGRRRRPARACRRGDPRRRRQPERRHLVRRPRRASRPSATAGRARRSSTCSTMRSRR